MDKVPHCREIWMCNLVNTDGSIRTGYRPVFILSNDITDIFFILLTHLISCNKIIEANINMFILL